MNRKKWTPKEHITEEVLQIRERRKWQIALRRYILEKNPSTIYAPYFGLDNQSCRQWIELQFEQGQHWDNFGDVWQFDHIIPISYFDFDQDSELKLCWNFINIRTERIGFNKNRDNRVDLLAAKAHFDEMFTSTGYSVCRLMTEKITRIERVQMRNSKALAAFISEKNAYIETLTTFDSVDFNRLNQGELFKDIVLEKEIIKKFGS